MRGMQRKYASEEEVRTGRAKPTRHAPRSSPERDSPFRGMFSSNSGDQPELAPGVQLLDLSIPSRALGKTVKVRLVFPIGDVPAASLPVIYLLPDNTGSFTCWTNQSEVTSWAARGAVLVMPDATGSFYIDDTRSWTGYYEQFFRNELAPAVRRRIIAAAPERQCTAILGASTGGYGALLLGLKHPHRFGFVGALGANVDLAQRPFSWRSPLKSWALHQSFGPMGSDTRHANDLFALAPLLDRTRAPLFHLTCGLRDPRLAANRRLFAELQQARLPCEWNDVPGGHNWAVWDAQLPRLEAALWSVFDGDGDDAVSTERPRGAE